jgi:hypothetical protein
LPRLPCREPRPRVQHAVRVHQYPPIAHLIDPPQQNPETPSAWDIFFCGFIRLKVIL